jgi:hypothetical protein
MSNKIIWCGIGLSGFGLGYFIPILLPVGAILVVVGVVLLILDK